MSHKSPLHHLLSESTPHQQQVMLHVFQQVAPLDFDIAGFDTAKRITRGVVYQSVEGGRHLNLTDTIGLLSGIATLSQMLLLTGFWIKKRAEEARAKREEEWELLFGPIEEQARQDKTVSELLGKNPDLIREIAQVIDRFYEKEEN